MGVEIGVGVGVGAGTKEEEQGVHPHRRKWVMKERPVDRVGSG